MNKYYSKNKHCKCGKLITNISKQCRACMGISRKGENNSNWKAKSFTEKTIEKLRKLNHKQNHPRWVKGITKEMIEKEYIINKSTTRETSKILNISTDALNRRILYYNIPKRNHSEAIKGKYKGVKISSSAKRNISKARLKNKSAVGKNNPMFGKHHSVESKKKMSLSQGGTGISYQFNNYPEEFFEIRYKIRKKYQYKCQLCSKYGKDVHHIDYDKNNNEENNLINLCHKCNIKVNKNRSYWTEYFKEKVRWQTVKIPSKAT